MNIIIISMQVALDMHGNMALPYWSGRVLITDQR